MNKALLICMVLVAVSPWGEGRADEGRVTLREGPGRELVRANCATCHSLDYIQMNSVFLNREGWQKGVDKMIRVMGAPVRPEDVSPIVDYLASAYGR